MKQQARALEQQGNADEALAMYKLVLAELDAFGGVRQELPLLIKIGDLQLKLGDVDGAVDMYERAATEYATQGVAQPVMSLCGKIVRADAQAVGAYLRLSRKLLEAGHIEGARQVLMDYAQRAKLDKTREGLEKLSGHAEANQRIVLTKAIDAAEERIPQRVPWARRPATAKPQAVEEEVEEEAEGEQGALDEVSPPEAPGGPKKRLTVPVGALDDLEPSLLEQHPPEPKKPEVTPESLFPTAADLQAPVAPATPSAPPPVAPPLPTPESIVTRLPPVVPVLPQVEPPRIDSISPLPDALPPLPPMPEPTTRPPLRISQELVIDSSFTPPPLPTPQAPAPFVPPPVEPRPEAPPPPGRPSRISRPQPRPSMVAATPPPRARPAPRRLWPAIGGAVLVGGVGALIWLKVIPVDRIRGLLSEREPPPVEVRTQPRRPATRAPDTVMARDRPAPVAAPPPSPAVAPARPLVPPDLPPGLVLTGVVYVVAGLPVESVEEFSPENRLGFRIIQVLPSGQPIILMEFPADSSVEGEIGVTGLPADTVVGHVRIGGVDVTLKGVISETLAVELLQQLVQVRP